MKSRGRLAGRLGSSGSRRVRTARCGSVPTARCTSPQASPDGDSGQILRFLADGRIPADSPGASPVYWSVDLMPAGIDWQAGRRLVVDDRNEPHGRSVRGATRWRVRRYRDRSAASPAPATDSPRLPRGTRASGLAIVNAGNEPVRRRRARVVDRPRRSAALRRQPRRRADRRSRTVAARPVRRNRRRHRHVGRRHLFLHPEQRHLGRRPRRAREAAVMQ